MNILAIISVYNEADILRHCVTYLLDNGIKVYVIDNGSTDGSLDTISDLGIEGSEVFHTNGFELSKIMKQKESIAERFADSMDWFINADADEFRDAPWAGMTLHDAMARVDSEGFNLINFKNCVFPHTGSIDPEGPFHPSKFLKWSPGPVCDTNQLRAWKSIKGVRVDLASSAGHIATFPGARIYPIKFIMRHYPLRSDEHMRRKIEKERGPRFSKDELHKGWHVQYGPLQESKRPKQWDIDEVRKDLIMESQATHNIALIPPQGFPLGSESMRDVAEALLETMKFNGHATMLSNAIQPGKMNVVLGWHLTPNHTIPDGSIVYNLEQLIGWDKWHPTETTLVARLNDLQKRCTIWDYSKQNIELLKGGGVQDVVHVPIGYAPCLARIQNHPIEDRDIDVLFYGSLNDRRKRIIQELLDAGISVMTLTDTYGWKRDALIARSKIVLNWHFYEGGSLELPRILYLMANNKCVVSEESPDMGDYPGIDEACVFVNQSNATQTILKILAEPALQECCEVSGRSWVSSKDRAQTAPLDKQKDGCATKTVKVCLCMIVKCDAENDEAHVIFRALGSVRGIVSCAAIVVTKHPAGIYSNLPQQIHNWFLSAGIPLSMVFKDWNDDFSEARNRAIALGECYEGVEWLLVGLDADEWFEGGKETEILYKLSKVEQDAAVVPLYTRQVITRPTFIRPGRGLHYQFRIHESIVTGDSQMVTAMMLGNHDNIFNGPLIRTKNDGARTRRRNKAETDLELLKKCYLSDTCPHYALHLGLTAYNMEKWDLAIYAFRAYTEEFPHDDQRILSVFRYMALVYLSRCLVRSIAKPLDACVMQPLFKALDLEPTRVEALGELAQIHYNAGAYQRAKIFALACAHAPVPRKLEMLEPHWAQWKGLEILAQSLIKLGQLSAAASYLNLLLSKDRLPVEERPRINALMNELNETHQRIKKSKGGSDVCL